MNKDIKYLQFNFDISAYRLLGRELITDRITALFELVKNSYDANAENVTVEFLNINPKTNESKIIISDNGIGMSFEDIRDKWMVIGTSSKRRNRVSSAPYYRKVVGKKGVGRFAVDKLGAKLLLKTKKEHSNDVVFLETDWSQYSSIEEQQLELNFSEKDKQQYFTDIENKYWLEEKKDTTHETILEISLINDVWSEDDISRAYKELAKLISPNFKSKHPFNITIKSQYEAYKNKKVESLAIQFATEEIHIGFDIKNKTQEILKAEDGILKKISVPQRSCGLVKFTLYYFDQQAKNKYKKYYGDLIDGIKIYRDGLITTPFAEYENSQNKQKDILGIDKRRYSGFFEKIGSRDILGYIEITDENNTKIIEATNRQDFVDNDAWKELKNFIIEQITQLELVLKQRKETGREQTKTKLSGASQEIKEFRKKINEAKNIATAPEVKQTLKEIEKRAGKLQATVNKGIKDYQELEKETKQKENLFFSLIPLQTYAAMLSHMTKHTIGITLRDVEYFNKHFPNPKYDDRFKKISERIYLEMLKLRSGVDFMLKYAQSDTEISEINIKLLIENLFYEIYKSRFEKENIRVLVEINKNLIINYNQKVFEDIFDNLIDNSVKALKNRNNKIIKCSSFVNKNDLVIYFSDNGIGIEEKDKYRIFDIFYTTTAEQGGAGIGLYVVKKRIEAMNGKIEVVENELKPTGASFKIELPFK
ncbi:MAG: sensor histidine kinase [Ignavibacteriae bacterium]|nr:sensor histidine kinase [Ignavibacteriota bacterium]